MERRKKERRKGVNARQDTLALMQRALEIAKSDNRTRHLVSRIQSVIEDIEDITVTLEKRRSSDRREITGRQLRLAGA